MPRSFSRRILHDDWVRYTGGEVVFRPAQMSVDKLQELYYYAWDTFYADESQNVKMAKLFMQVIEKETADGTYRGARIRKGGWRTPSVKQP